MPQHLDNPLSVYRRGCELLYEYTIKNNIAALVTGSSGGLDSAVTLGFCAGAVSLSKGNLKSIGVVLPCQSSPRSVYLGFRAIEAFNAEARMIHLDNAYKAMKEILPGGEGIANGNIKARLRMITLYHIAKQELGMVMSTDNYSEYLMGFWTLHGDVGDFGICQNLWKGTEMYDIARAIGVPQEIIDAKPDDGLGVSDGGDEAQLGAPYEEIDNIMENIMSLGFNPDGNENEEIKKVPSTGEYSSSIAHRLALRSLRNSYKRRGCVNLTREQLGL